MIIKKNTNIKIKFSKKICKTKNIFVLLNGRSNIINPFLTASQIYYM